MAFSLTSEQQAAVDNRGGGLLVSAAAGSGKTRVLVERLLARVEGEGLDIDRFLVITYTKAAAAELRGRIVEELSARLERYGFFRCHRSYLVNMQKVQEVVRWTRNSYALRLENGPESGVPLSKGRIDAMRRQYRF